MSIWMAIWQIKFRLRRLTPMVTWPVCSVYHSRVSPTVWGLLTIATCTPIHATFWNYKSFANQQWFRFICSINRDAAVFVTPSIITATNCNPALLRHYYCSCAAKYMVTQLPLNHSADSAVWWLLTVGPCMSHLFTSIAWLLEICIHTYLRHMAHS